MLHVYNKSHRVNMWSYLQWLITAARKTIVDPDSKVHGANMGPT